ncbi:subclass B1 metallo-beta-lactamase [Alcanivorax jadensis]|uniref:subclass B1 metallo-beta-lactamase n=1 Tax=Alcanivorax jadensis TaxID=64988 RepID=UPI003569274C
MMRIALALLLFISLPLQAEEIRLSDDLQVYPLTEHTWVHRSWEVIQGQRYASNGLIIIEDNTLTLIDTAWGDAPTALLLDWMEQRFGKAPDLAILTHSHDDRMGGASTLAARGIPAWAHPATLDIARNDPGTFYDPDIPLPRTIEAFTEQSRIKFANLELYYPGPAHSPDNIIVWYGRDEVLIGGCAVKGGSATAIGYVEGSNANHWPVAMENVLTHYSEASIVVPGHGDIGDASLLTHTRDLARQGLATQ